MELKVRESHVQGFEFEVVASEDLPQGTPLVRSRPALRALRCSTGPSGAPAGFCANSQAAFRDDLGMI